MIFIAGRAIAIGVDVAAAESWSGLSEREICERIVETRPSYKRLVGLLPPEIGLTRAIVAAAIFTLVANATATAANGERAGAC